MSTTPVRPTVYGWFEVLYPETLNTAQAGLVHSTYATEEQANAAAEELAASLDLPTGYEVVDGNIQARHETGQFCDCEECSGPDLTAVVPSIGKLMAYEQGELDDDGIVELFAALVETGVAWQLQGSYGRTAMQLIDAGLIGARL